MERRYCMIHIRLMIVMASAISGGLVSPASAGLIASDSYLIGTNPAAGQYQEGVPLKNQPVPVTVAGFDSLGYSRGTVTAQFASTSVGLAYSPIGASATTSGKVTYSAAPLDNTPRVVAHNLTAVASSDTYWMSQLVRRGDNPTAGGNGYVLAGFGNTVAPAFGTTSGFLEGLFFGFSEHGIANDFGDLVIRYRDGTGMTSADKILVDGSVTSTLNQTYEIVTRLDVNVNGGSIDHVSWWLNPTNFSSQNGLTNSASASGSFDSFALQLPTDFVRLNYASMNWNGGADFDESRLGTTLDSLTTGFAVPEPGSIVLLVLGWVGGLGMAIRHRARAQMS